MSAFAELVQKLQAIDPRVRLVSAKWLRRIIRRHRDMSASSKPAPHEIGYWIPSRELVQFASPADLGIDGELPETVLLLPAVEGMEGSKAITLYWRALFHLAIDQTMDQKPTDEQVKQFIRKLGGTTWQEVREVVQGQELLFDDPSDRDFLREFAAFFLELKYFQPEWLGVYFPGIPDPAAMEALLGEFISAADFFVAMRPEGAAGTVVVAKEIASEVEPEEEKVPPVDPQQVDHPDEPRRLGNDVRAAVLCIKTGKIQEAEACLKSLILRLQKALGHEAYDDWWQSLRPLLDRAARHYWPRELRLLYELQKICVDAEKGLYSVEVMEWVMTLGKHPVKRKLDKPREVNQLRHLRRADHHLQACRLDQRHRQKLTGRLVHEMHAAEKRIRAQFSPILHETLQEVGLTPANTAEKISCNKLVDELIDVICERGFLKFSDVRDAIARNRLKLDDQSPTEFITGDELLQINRKLPYKLDGIYHRGEIYLRLMQRLSALLFGTLLGRLFTKFVALPFGGAYLILEAVHHLFEAVAGGLHFLTGHGAKMNAFGFLAGGPAEVVAKDPHLGTHTLATLPAIGVLGFFLLLVIHWPWFRWQVAKTLKEILVDWPRKVLSSPFVRRLFDNVALRYFFRFLLVPVLCGVLVAVLTRGIFEELPWFYCWLIGLGAAVFAASFFRTPLGRGMEERFNDSVNDAWELFSSRLILGVFSAIMNFFKSVFEAIEKFFYTVDEWLRFREGDSVVSYYFKMAFSLVWFFVTYVFRFVWNLLVEPQINPIKHFPVVTVSHKLLLPLIPNLADAFGTSLATMTTIVGLIPGIFGFLAWEFKENWKLYRANRPEELAAVPVGSHGERVRGLLRPGFHSGVVPKTYRKLRDGTTNGNSKRVHRANYQLHHIEEALHHLITREFLAYLKVSKRWNGLPIEVKEIHLATNRVWFVFAVGLPAEELTVVFEQRNGWMLASLEKYQAFKHWTPAQQAAFLDVLTALYKLSGIHLVREQLRAAVQSEAFATDCNLEALIVPTRTDPVVYPYNDRPVLHPVETDNSLAKPIPRREILFSETPLKWDDWAARWEQDAEGKSPTQPLVPMKLVR